jgi:hypothetical protein
MVTLSGAGKPASLSEAANVAKRLVSAAWERLLI